MHSVKSINIPATMFFNVAFTKNDVKLVAYATSSS